MHSRVWPAALVVAVCSVCACKQHHTLPALRCWHSICSFKCTLYKTVMDTCWCAACRGDRVERARLYKAPNEACFGVQVATNNIAEGLKAAQLAADAGAAWLDLNCGCPIYGEWGCCPCGGPCRSWVQSPCTPTCPAVFTHQFMGSCKYCQTRSLPACDITAGRTCGMCCIVCSMSCSTLWHVEGGRHSLSPANNLVLHLCIGP
jgi:hypothetical protein